LALFGLGVVVAAGSRTPTLGGWLTDQYTWRWAFYINVPIGVSLQLFHDFALRQRSAIPSNPPSRERIDSIGLGLLAVWIGALQIIFG